LFSFFLLYEVSKLNLKIEISERIRRIAPHLLSAHRLGTESFHEKIK